MMTWLRIIPRFQFALTAALLLSFFSARAGLIIEISDKIDITSIKTISIQKDNLIILYGSNEKKVIALPDGGMDNLLLWVKQPCTGPFVISVDGALVPGSPTYTSPCLPPSLARAMIGYDVYAHSFAQGEIPVDSMLHPLIQNNGNMFMMPHLQFRWLMDPNNQSPNALWYRNLTSRFPSLPGVIGEFTIKAIPSKGNFPVKIEVVAHRWFRPSLWYREVTAPSEFDNTTFDLPYVPLKKDIESRFEVYRERFKPFNELASFVEGYAILKKIFEKKPEIWSALLKNKCKQNKKNCIQAGAISRESGPDNSWDDSWGSKISWQEWSIGSIGETVETTQEADLALCLLWDYEDLSYWQSDEWEVGIAKIAKQYPDIEAKYLLYLFKNELISNKNREVWANRFLKLTRKNKDLFRIRIVGCQIMLDFEDGMWLDNLIDEERHQILKDFIISVDSLKKHQDESNDDFLIWEDLSQSVFSTGLLSFLGERLNDKYHKSFNSEFARALAYIMYRRGQSFYLGLGLAYQHSDLRYLGYLANSLNPTRDRILIEKIYDYRSRLALNLGISGWNEDEFNDAFSLDLEDGDSEYEPEIPESDVTLEPWKNAPIIEGYLISATSLFHDQKKSTSLPQDGSPVGVYSADGSFILLLLDSRIFLTNKVNTKNLVRVYGIIYQNTQAITPLRIETKGRDGQWTILDIPHSGVSERGVFDGY